MVGTGQRTLQSLRIEKGTIAPSDEDFEWDDDEPVRDELGRLLRRVVDGDGTVGRDSAVLPCAERQYLSQQHGSLARSPEATDYVRDVIRERPTGTRQAGETELGVETPDVVVPGEQWTIIVTGIDGVTAATCAIQDADSGRLVDKIPLQRRNDEIVATATLAVPGVYRVEVSGGGASAVGQLVLVIEPDD
jgi:hypothetical protein